MFSLAKHFNCRAYLKLINFKWFLACILFCSISVHSLAEGSANWGIEGNRQSWLWYPGNSGSGGFANRGYMLLPSEVSGYNGAHRLYVYVKSGETVFWGFRRHGSSGNIRVKWFYDAGSTDFFPTGTVGSSRTIIDWVVYNADGNGGGNGRPDNARATKDGPSQITGTGYQAYSFVNNTGASRAFWVEISNASDNHITSGFNINLWDITVASGSPGAYSAKTGRVYSRFWSIVNSRQDAQSSTMTLTKASQDDYSFHNNFGFFVPVDNTYSPEPDDYFVKYINFGGSSGGWTNFFANKDGPRNSLSYSENRKSIGGVTKNIQYPLFISDPDPTIWKTTASPSASLSFNYSEKKAPEYGAEATVNVAISLPAIVDILIDINGNLIFDQEIDVLLSKEYASPGSYQVYWDGKDALGNVVPPDSHVEVIATAIFYPVHFPIFDLEQSLGMRVTNIRPGAVANNTIFWDDSLIPRTGITPSDSPQSAMVNTIGTFGPEHIWWASGDNGFSNNMTINTWTGSSNTEIRQTFRILPVQWMFFHGKSIENRVKIEWGTAQEKDNSFFVLQRSKDAKNWIDINKTNGVGNSESPVNYEDWDTNPLIGPNYYRIRQVDFNGTESFASVIRVDFIPGWEVHLYPNPVKNELFIQAKDIEKVVVFLMDSKGSRITLSSNILGSNKMSLDVSGILPGLYLISVQLENNLLVKKLIKI